MASLNGFNASDVDPTADFEAIPPGQYTAIITESENKPNKAGTGSYLQFTFQIVDGEHKGRLLWARLNLDNPSETAVKIARGQLSALCRAVNVLQPRDSLELHNIPLVIKVGVKRRDDTGEFTNEVKGFAPRGGAAGGTPSGNGVAPRPAATAGSTPPWKR
ncbi:MAG: DUF669 domain-containing protein [Planctomycetota bacterium]